MYFSARKTVSTDPPVIAPHQPTHVIYKTYAVLSCMSYSTKQKLKENEGENVNNCPTRCDYKQFFIFLQTALHVSGDTFTHHQE